MVTAFVWSAVFSIHTRTFVKFVYLMMRGERRIPSKPKTTEAPARESRAAAVSRSTIDSLLLESDAGKQDKPAACVDVFGLDIKKESDSHGQTT